MSDPRDEPAAAYRPRVLVVDDSAPQRGAIAQFLEDGGCDVVGRAMDGVAALSMVDELNPDVITCDLEMPRMDGFTFLRVLSKLRATPVIVITCDARPESALMALELGARDFVVKPARVSDLHQMEQQLIARIRGLVLPHVDDGRALSRSAPAMPLHCSVVVIGASTGGPKALRDIFGQVKSPPIMPVLIAQHMPPRFTEAFADRLRKASHLEIKEAVAGEIVRPGHIRVAPGGKHLRVEGFVDDAVKVGILEAQAQDRWIPSVDILLRSAAAFARDKLLGVVLTGMGKDGTEGARALRDVGAPLWTESSISAAIDGMPQSAAAAHGAADRIPLQEMATHLARVFRGEGRTAPAVLQPGRSIV